MSKKKVAKKAAKKRQVKRKTPTNQERVFIAEYLISLDPYDAARKARYSETVAKTKAYQWVSNSKVKPHVYKAIRDRMRKREERTNITADRVLEQVGRMTFFDPRRLSDEEGRPISLHKLPDDVAMAIQGVELVTIGNKDAGFGEVTKYKMTDRNSAAEKLMKHLGLYSKDNAQKGLADASPEEVAKILAQRLKAQGIKLEDLA